MNLRLLGIFRAIMASGSTSGAARSLGISQPSVSNAIRQLEDELGFELFDRVGNRLAAREEARVLLKESEAMFLFARRLDDVAEDLKENRIGRVRVTATPQLGHTVLPGAIQRFLADRPKVKVVCDVIGSRNVVESTEALTADFGMAIALEPELSVNLQMALLTKIELVCVLCPNHPLANRATLTPGDLNAYPMVALESVARLNPLIRAAFSRAGVPFLPNIEVRYSETACLLARAGAGVTVVDWLSANILPRDGSVVVIPFRPQILVDVWAIFPKERPLSRLAEALLDEVRESLDRLQRKNS